MLHHQSSAGPLRFAFTDRHGGVSAAPHDELNLGGHVGDDAAAVTRNRRLVAAAVERQPDHVLYMNQVHGNAVAVVEEPWNGPAPQVDALVTTNPALALAVLVADCVPVLLGDPVAGVAGVAHAGRPGLVAGVVPAVVAAMQSAGAVPERMVAVVGPSVCGACYEVPDEMRRDVSAAVPEAWATTRAGTPAVDVPGGVLAQLHAAGVSATRVEVCTLEDPSSYSYRRDHATGRFAGLAWMAA